MKEININKESFYRVEDTNREKTKKRLEQIKELGLKEVGTAQFGIPGIVSGLYIEKVWNLSDTAWAGWLEWIEKLKIQKGYKDED